MVDIAARDHSPGLGVLGQKMLDRFHAAHAAWNSQVKDDGGKVKASVPALGVQFQGLFALLGEDRLIAEFAKHLAHHLPHQDIVVHHQDASVAGERPGFSRFFLPGHAAFEGRQEQVKGGAPAYLLVHGDVAAGLADDGVGGGQTQPGALLFGGEIRVKDFLQIFRSDAPPGR